MQSDNTKSFTNEIINVSKLLKKAKIKRLPQMLLYYIKLYTKLKVYDG